MSSNEIQIWQTNDHDVTKILEKIKSEWKTWQLPSPAQNKNLLQFFWGDDLANDIGPQANATSKLSPCCLLKLTASIFPRLSSLLNAFRTYPRPKPTALSSPATAASPSNPTYPVTPDLSSQIMREQPEQTDVTYYPQLSKTSHGEYCPRRNFIVQQSSHRRWLKLVPTCVISGLSVRHRVIVRHIMTEPQAKYIM